MKNSELAWNKTVDFQEVVKTTENKKDIYLAEAEKTAMAWKVSEKARIDLEEAQAALENKEGMGRSQEKV